MVTYFKLKTSFDLFYRFGNGAIDNTQLKAFIGQRNSTFLNFFKSKLRRKTSKIHKEVIEDSDEITDKFDSIVFGKEEEKLDYKI